MIGGVESVPWKFASTGAPKSNKLEWAGMLSICC
jgi:hypothetical protein